MEEHLNDGRGAAGRFNFACGNLPVEAYMRLRISSSAQKSNETMLLAADANVVPFFSRLLRAYCDISAFGWRFHRCI